MKQAVLLHEELLSNRSQLQGQMKLWSLSYKNNQIQTEIESACHILGKILRLCLRKSLGWNRNIKLVSDRLFQRI